MTAKKKAQPDWWILISCLCLLAVGIIMVFSSSQYDAVNAHNDAFHFIKTQCLAAAVGFVSILIVYKLSMRALRSFTIPVALVVLGVLIFILASPTVDRISGAERWLTIGGLNFQPSELCKIALPMVMAKFLTDRQEQIKSFGRSFLPAIVIIGMTAVLIYLQTALSSAVVVAATGFIMMFCAGIRGLYLLGTVSVGVAAVGAAIIGTDFRMGRIMSWLDPWSDPSDGGLQMIQSLLAFGNGGLTGVGLGAGGSKWYYLPERHTDFILSVLGEELGFIGVLFVILLFVLLFWRGLMVAVHTQDTYASLLALGLTCSLLVQTLMNMGVVTGLLPITGITLPFISYGGTSLVISLCAVGLLLNISRQAKR